MCVYKVVKYTVRSAMFHPAGVIKGVEVIESFHVKETE